MHLDARPTPTVRTCRTVEWAALGGLQQQPRLSRPTRHRGPHVARTASQTALCRHCRPAAITRPLNCVCRTACRSGGRMRPSRAEQQARHVYPQLRPSAIEDPLVFTPVSPCFWRYDPPFSSFSDNIQSTSASRAASRLHHLRRQSVASPKAPHL